MKQFIEKDNVVEKYDVKVDEFKLQELRLEIINDCSEIIHHDYYGNEGPEHYDFLKIRNLKEQKMNHSSHKSPIYHITYDEYIFPYLVNIIDHILQEDDDIIDELVHPNYTKEESYIMNRKKEIIMDLFVNDDVEFSRKEKGLAEYKKLLDSEKLNSNRKDIKPYYQQVANCITFILESVMEKEQIDEVLQFLELKNKEEKKKRVLN